MEDLTGSIMQGLREMYAYQRGEIYLPTFEEFVKELENHCCPNILQPGQHN